MKVTSNAVSKTGAWVLTASFPIGETCRQNAPCYRDCYARRGHMALKSYRDKMQKNLNIYQENPDVYYNLIHAELILVPYKYFRWFVSGDMPDEKFFSQIAVRLAEEHKDTQFLMFTKKYEYVNAFVSEGNSIPSNLNVVFSCWGNFMPKNPYNLPTSHVRFKKAELNSHIPANATECAGKCYQCMECWTLKRGESVAFNKH